MQTLEIRYKSLNEPDTRPPLCKGVDPASSDDGMFGRPDRVGPEAGIDWDGNGFKPGLRPKGGFPYLMDTNQLKCEMPNGIGTYVEMDTVAEGGFAFVIEGLDAPRTAMFGDSANPNGNVSWDGSIFPESVSELTGEEGLRFPVGVIQDNSLNERKSSD